MRDYPPRITTPSQAPDQAGRAPAAPDTRSPARFLWWLVRFSAGPLAVYTACQMLWFLGGAASPYLIGRAIDTGVLHLDPPATLGWSSLLLLAVLISAAAGIAAHTYAVRTWLIGLYGVQKLATRKAARLGHLLARRAPTGEVLSVSSGDSVTLGATLEVIGRCLAALVAFLAVAGIVLTVSVKLGIVVLIAAPILVGAAAPLLRPLQAAQKVERGRSSELTGMATDIVAGLRILRGIGGEATFGDNYARQSQSVRSAGVLAGSWSAAVDGAAVLLSGLLLVTLTWLGAHEMLAGRLTIGQLVSFFGYAIFMVWPIETFFETAMKITQALVAGEKVVALLGPQSPWPRGSMPFPANPRLVDGVSGAVIEPGKLTMIVSGVPDDASALADRLGRYLPASAESNGDADETEARGKAARELREVKRARRQELIEADARRATEPWGVTADGIDYSEFSLDELRRTVMVSESSAHVFAGTLQRVLDPHSRATRAQAEDALRTAAAEDVYDSLPGGWQGRIDERGRGLSGGQRQRLVLARALLANPAVLVLVEPTSAVDAHTEARIAAALPEARRGRTTVVTTVSPLLLRDADRVVLLVDGRAVATGTHASLLAGSDEYRRVVARAMDAEEVANA